MLGIFVQLLYGNNNALTCFKNRWPRQAVQVSMLLEKTEHIFKFGNIS